MTYDAKAADGLRELNVELGGVERLGKMTARLDGRALVNDLVEAMFEGERIQTDLRWTDPVNPADAGVDRMVEMMRDRGFETSRERLADLVNSDFGRSMIPVVRDEGTALFGPDDFPEDGTFPGDPRVAAVGHVVVGVIVVAAIVLGFPRDAN